MSKITYDNKVGIEPKTVAINQVQDVDMNLIKNVVNENDTCSVTSVYPILADKTSAGRRYGSVEIPMAGLISLSLVNVQEGGCGVIIWTGGTLPTFTGAPVYTLVGVVEDSGIYSIYYHFLNGGFNINIFGKMGEAPPPSAPNKMTLNSVLSQDSTAPNKMTINSIS